MAQKKKAKKASKPVKKVAKKAAKPSKATPKAAAKVKKFATPARPVKKTVKAAKSTKVSKAKKVGKAAPASKPSTAPRPAPVAVTKSSSLPPPRPLMPIRPPPVLKGAMTKTKKLTAKDLAEFRSALLHLRDRIIDKISFLAKDNLNRSQQDTTTDLSSHGQHMGDQGTENFDREFAANMLSNEQDSLYEIDEALRRIDNRTYGICESTGKPIEYERLKALPFVRYCVAAQTEMERGKPRFRPFRRTTSIQSLEPQP